MAPSTMKLPIYMDNNATTTLDLRAVEELGATGTVLRNRPVQRFLIGSIIPGNRNYGHPTEKFLFQQLLTLEVQGYECLFHRLCSSSIVGPLRKTALGLLPGLLFQII